MSLKKKIVSVIIPLFLFMLLDLFIKVLPAFVAITAVIIGVIISDYLSSPLQEYLREDD